MQFTLFDLLKQEHIIIGLEAQTAEDVIRALSTVLVKSNYVTEEFAEDVLTRELTFPTGLPTYPVAVAIPHADPDHVQRSAFAIGILKNPVKFSQMGTNGSTYLDVHIIFLLAIKEREKQVELIRQLMLVIQSPKLLSVLLKAKHAEETELLIKQFIK